MSNSYHKNLVFTAACIGMCFFGVSMITLGAVLPSLIAKLNLSGLQTTSLVTFLPLGMLAGSLIFGPIVDRFGHKALLVPSCIIVLLGMEGLAFFESVPLLQASIVGIGLGGASSTEKPMHWYPTSQENPKKAHASVFWACSTDWAHWAYQCCWAPFPGIIHSKPSYWELA